MNTTHFLGFEVLHARMMLFAIAVPVVLFIGLWGLRRRAKERAQLVAPRLQARFLPRFSSARAATRVWFAAAAVMLLAFALVGPVRGYTLREVQRKGFDLVVCVDTSRSMLVQDLKPNRLTRAEREVIGLLDKLKNDRAGLLAFAGDVRDVAPLTHDRATLKAFVSTLTPEDNVKGGTDIGGVLEKALSLFDGRTGASEAIVLLTDGEDLEGQGLVVANKAKERKIRIYVVGMATAEGGKIPDGTRGFMHDEDGSEVVSKLDRKSLTATAEATDGAYIGADSSAIPLEELYDKRITQLEGRELFAGKERIPHDRYQWPLALAALCMITEVALRERRSPPAAKQPISIREAA